MDLPASDPPVAGGQEAAAPAAVGGGLPTEGQLLQGLAPGTGDLQSTPHPGAAAAVAAAAAAAATGDAVHDTLAAPVAQGLAAPGGTSSGAPDAVGVVPNGTAAATADPEGAGADDGAAAAAEQGAGAAADHHLAGSGGGEGAEGGSGDGVEGRLEALDQEMLKFAEEAAPTEDEAQRKASALESIRSACSTALHNNKRMRVQLFGSAAHGIGLRGSDLDVVVTDFITPFQVSGVFTPEQKENVGTALRRISDALMRQRACSRRPLIIYNARVPIAKLDMSNGVKADISIGSASGVQAASFLMEQQERFPVLRPLCMVVKALLLEAGLQCVERGGLSTWSLCNMALALLLEQEKAGCATHCAGHLLLGFLKYYGRVFDYTTQAVAVKQGGIVAKADVALCNSKPPTQGADGPAARQAAAQQGRLCVEDPITGRDVSSGSHQIQAVAQVLRDAASKLELLLNSPSPPPQGLLPMLFDMPAALEGRLGEGASTGGREPAWQAGSPGLKRGREGGAGGAGLGPRKGGPGPMVKQQSGPRGSVGLGGRQAPYAVRAGGGGPRGSGLGGGGMQPQPLLSQQQQQQQVGGVSGPTLMLGPGGGLLQAGSATMMQPGGMATALVLPQLGTAVGAGTGLGTAPIFLQQQQQQPQLAQQLMSHFVGQQGAGGVVVLGGGGGMQQGGGVQLAAGAPSILQDGSGGLYTAQGGGVVRIASTGQAPQQLVMTPMGIMVSQPAVAQQAQQAPIFFTQQAQPGGGYMQ